MSRSGKKIIAVPDKVKVRTDNGVFFAEGPMGKQQVKLNSLVDIVLEPTQIKVIQKEKTSDSNRAHGMIRSLVNNAVIGVSAGFKKVLEIEGVGYRADVKGSILNLTLGFSHPINFDIPQGIKVAVEKQTKITITGDSKILVGQVAADIRGYKPPEPYKGKGIRYEGEHIERKAGKAAAGGAK